MILGLKGFFGLLVIGLLGLPLGYALIASGTVAFGALRGFEPAFSMAGQQILDITTKYEFSVLPMFLLMAAFIERANLAREMYEAWQAWLGHRRGGLAMATIAACGGFSAVCGTSVATSAVMSKISVREMRRYGYSDGLSTGSVAAGGTLGILIPPSVPLVLYGLLTRTDIAKLFIAGIIPGIVLVGGYFAAVMFRTRLNPDDGPAAERVGARERWLALGRVWGVLLLFIIVMGSMYAGIATPTEAAAIGASGAFLFALLRKRLSWQGFVLSLVEAGVTTATVLIVLAGAMIFGNFIALSGLPWELLDWINSLSLSPMGVVLVICAITVALGCIFESIGLLLLTVPLFFPVITGLGLDPVWFGIIFVVCLELGLITPPVGLNVFVVKAALPDIPISTIFRGAGSFVIAHVLVLLLLVFVPQITLFLANKI
ncbi:TRAP transporter large permease [Alkalilimnicola sp. S0819]|uniref:TRAP transporter large permease n=1 Tax=Alkalilimnicola sp. S0819 TaxID=2613922 RepID=UPI0012618E39|nr:TRAP transporter large permease [Alkalilimnicola sp. S0819]KAB7619522.1 TRAP transporter large permease [Alkalilimnicola sp. S0819]MPQ17671.1 TRAP transporter large permease subunit [Alkalilimnicola sp. S0819]